MLGTYLVTQEHNVNVILRSTFVVALHNDVRTTFDTGFSRLTGVRMTFGNFRDHSNIMLGLDETLMLTCVTCVAMPFGDIINAVS